MLYRAYSLLSAKSVDDERRVITGMASTPRPDRMEDVVEPMGAVFQVPMPLLLYHQNMMPVGNVEFAKPTKGGIPFQASLPNVVEPGIVQDHVNQAWHSLKYKLIGAVSIGFRALKDGVELIKDGGLRFKAWEWLELSLVTVPANSEAVIQSFKSMDSAQIHRVLGLDPVEDDPERIALIKSLTSQRAASGRTQKTVVQLITPGVSGQSAHKGSVKLIPR